MTDKSSERIAEIEADVATYGALYTHPREDVLYLLDKVKQLEESESYIETYIDALKQRDAKILKLEQTRLDLLGEISSLDDHNINLEERCKKLEKLYDMKEVETKQLLSQVWKLERVRDKLVTTLEFYADPKHWTIEWVEGSYGDYGSRARAALAACEETDDSNSR